MSTSSHRTAQLDLQARSGLEAALRQVADQGQLEHLHQERWGQTGTMAAWLGQEALAGLSESQALALYRASGGTHTAQFRTSPIADIRDSLDFLLYDTISLESRFAEFAAEDGFYKLAGAGKELASFLLCLREPGLFAPWRPYTERALRRLEMYPATLRQGHLGLRYLDLLDALQRLRQQLGPADFRWVDSFCYTVGRLPKPVF
ncbi:MAG: hypothetical protein EXR54_05685 [Dehalococcoidia bacterium]|nr:hypothetical protein [Dehalococcoidia bacterium]MSQ17047.1 hypothetical protein [Dehalococcoidia bacterium]